MAVSDQQVLTWLQNNLTASDKDIYEAMKIYDVSPEQLSRVTGKPVEEIVSRVGQVEQQYPGVATAGEGGVADWQIKKWLQANPDVTDEQIYSAMKIHNVNPTQLSRVTGVPVSQIEQRMAPFIPTGQVGFEAATEKGVTDASQSLTKAQDEVRDLFKQNVQDIQGAQTLARTDLQSGQEEIARLYGLNVADVQAAQTQARADLEAAQQQMAQQYGLNIQDIQAAQQQAMQDVRSTFGQAAGAYQPYQTAGETALQRQMALSGALGQDAFQQAYVEDPYIAFLREQGMRANLAGAAATGGLGGGNVQKELQRFGQGLAAQGVQQQIQNLAGLSGMGLNAAGGAAGVQQALGTNLANLGMTGAEMTAAQRAALAGQYGQTGANLANLGMTGAELLAGQRGALAGYQSQTAANLANLGMTGAEMLSGQRGALAGYESQTGTNLANLQAQAAANIAAQRARTGELLANQLGTGVINLGNLATSQGADIASGISGQTANIQNLQQGSAASAANAAQQLGINQANLASGQDFTGQPYINWGNTIPGALSAAGTGFNLGEMWQGQQQPTSSGIDFGSGIYNRPLMPYGSGPNYFSQPSAPGSGINFGAGTYSPPVFPQQPQQTGLYYNGLMNLSG